MPHRYSMGVIGNCSYMAYVDETTRVRWLCWPRFDSGFVFGSLLDPERGGEFAIHPLEEATSFKQYYLGNTNVLVTEVRSASGGFRVTDFAPRFVNNQRIFRPHTFIRKVEPIDDYAAIRVACRPVRDYGEGGTEAHVESNHIRYESGPDRIRLYSNIPLTYIEGGRTFALNGPKYLVLTWNTRFERPLESTAEGDLHRTVEYWQGWVRGCSIGRFFQSQVIRSALALKLHQFEDTGAIIASGSCGLPEFPGSGRNWDYRYCWLRDAYYTLSAFSRISQFEEMQKFASFIEDIAVEHPERLPPLVRVDGATDLDERVLELRGYDGTGRVLVGNAAYLQVQNDVYGQILYALLQLNVDVRFPAEFKRHSRDLILENLRRIEATLDQPDATLWEFRGLRMHHCYTALFNWIGAKTAARIGRAKGDATLVGAATGLITKAARRVEACYDPGLRAYKQAPDRNFLDASTLQLIIQHYLPPGSDRARSHLAAIERELVTPEGFVHRYSHADDFGVPKNTFLMCAFWYAEALAVMGRTEDALRTLENLLASANGLGLFSEHVDSATGDQWGNFPQTYSHVGLMNAVARISQAVDYPEFF